MSKTIEKNKYCYRIGFKYLYPSQILINNYDLGDRLTLWNGKKVEIVRAAIDFDDIYSSHFCDNGRGVRCMFLSRDNKYKCPNCFREDGIGIIFKEVEENVNEA